ncbi:MAG: hypothetical protein ACE5D8_01185 [Fidelibacterota bacterium]
MENDFVLIGVDGGATKTTACLIEYQATEGKFHLTTVADSLPYHEQEGYRSDFQPVDLQTQLDEKDQTISLTSSERTQGNVIIAANARVIQSVLRSRADKPVLIGIGFPGLKTSDGRGISAMANGPRMPQFLTILEDILRDKGVRFTAPIARLGSDADYCGLGEEFGVRGQFSDVDQVYYLGGGTGAADALKLQGKLVPFDHTKTWLAKTWELMNTKGVSMERYASAGGIQWVYSTYANIPLEDVQHRKIYPSQILSEAHNGSPAAIDTFHDVATNLAMLLFERMTTVYCGWKDLLEFVNPNREALNAQHPFTGTLLERIVIGQRLGELLKQSKDTGLFWDELERNLTDLVTQFPDLDSTFVNYYCPQGRFNMNLISISPLREAPALGAAIDAFQHWRSTP